jgi:chromosome segregation protein
VLKLDRLEISGFKSFVDPVELRFAGGITAIVGPNGCGKSNISDAMTWVLGEQSAKSLRGDKMEDVIFAGTEQRKPLGMAEVVLHLRTDPSFPHSEDGRVSIGRRVFRSGDSQYRLNGRVVRLKEIKDLLMDTGLGLRAYSVIEQGKVGMILSGKPQERRRLLEEAAGITRYKQRKRVAEVKLEESLANLLRLDDVISEVDRSLRSLKRQAAAARRYKLKEAEYRELLAQVLTGRWALAKKRLAEVAELLAAAQGREAERAAAVAREEAALADGRERQEELAATLAETHQRHADLAATIEGRQQFLKASRERRREIGERGTRSQELAERRRGEIARHREALALRRDERGAMEAERAAAAGEVERDQTAIDAAETRLAEVQARVEEGRRRLLADIGELNALRNRRHQGQIELEKANLRRQHLADELAEHEHDLGRAGEALEMAKETVAGLGARLTESEAEAAKVAKALESTVAREKEAGDEVRDLERRLAEAGHRRKLLAELAAAQAERRERLVAALAEVEGTGGASPTFLAERLHAVAGWERSLDFFLADLENAVLVEAGAAGGGDAAETALAVARQLAAGPGATVLAPLGPGSGWTPEAAAALAAPIVEDPKVVLSLGEALGLDEALAAALPPAFLVESPDDAARLARRHPGVAFLSRDGYWAAGGAVHVAAGEAAPGTLERERQLQELDAEIPRLEARLAEVRGLLAKLVERRSALARESNQLQGALARLAQERAVAEARQEDAAARHRRLGVERETLVTETEEVQRELARRAAGHEELADALAEAERRHRSLEEEADADGRALEAAKAERESLREASAGRRGRLDLLAERLVSHDREMARLGREIEEGERQVREWLAEGERLTGRGEELETEIAAAESELQAALERRAGVSDEVIAAQERLDEQRAKMRQLEAAIADSRRRRDEARGEVEELRVRQAGLEHDAEHAAAAFRDELGRPRPVPVRAAADDGEGEEGSAGEGEGGAARLDGAARMDGAAAMGRLLVHPSSAAGGAAGEAVEAGGEATAAAEPGEPAAGDGAAAAESVSAEPVLTLPETPPEPPANLAELEADLARTRAALERLGPVNVLAVEEHDEQEERHAFLTTQRADVAQSVDSLKRTIREINQASSERFRETFAAVNAQFGVIFARLFRGGEAEMRLLDEEDLLETGIEIVARPPGKRLQNIMLMSGGEKALTAIALLFALFHAKPSPFCILDEVDAPLDDINTLRYAETLRELAGDTQFLVITHNKLTMESASTLYGVTMQEKGVSRLVAVELDEVEPERATA